MVVGLLQASPSVGCIGDCDGNGVVTVDELVRAVNVALGLVQLNQCSTIDCDGNGHPGVDCLVQAVNAALSGCPPSPTPSMTATLTPAPTSVATESPTFTSTPTASASPAITPATPTLTPTPLSLPLQPMRLILEGQPAALLSISGTSAADVYAVGADPQDGTGPYVLHYDGQNWHRLKTHSTGSLWWISVTPIDGSFYMAGENGVVLRYQPSTQTFTPLPSLGAATQLFGVWGTDANQIWAVGRALSNGPSSGVMWRFDGAKWTLDTGIAALLSQSPLAFYKVWGRDANDLYVVGQQGDEQGLVFHFDGAVWTQSAVDLNGASPASSPLFTVHGNDTQVVAVGGFFSGLILELQGASFANVAPEETVQMNGVFIRPDGSGVAVGIAGALGFRGIAGWQYQRLNITLDFHGAWVDPEGGVWAVGGDLTTALNQGILAYGGVETIGSNILVGN
ncbi:MAG TPA: hypothetical protein VL403_19710 [Candidatus Kryptonia bacterium]|nr:hypothetical protein [Candidatus Kryptonia bacterium]